MSLGVVSSRGLPVRAVEAPRTSSSSCSGRGISAASDVRTGAELRDMTDAAGGRLDSGYGSESANRRLPKFRSSRQMSTALTVLGMDMWRDARALAECSRPRARYKAYRCVIDVGEVIVF